MNQWTPKGQKQIDPHESLTTEERAFPEELFSASWVPNQCGESLTRWSKVSHHTPSIYNSFAIHLPFIYHSFTIDSTNTKGALTTPSLFILWRQFTSLISWLRLHIFSLKNKYQYIWWKTQKDIWWIQSYINQICITMCWSVWFSNGFLWCDAFCWESRHHQMWSSLA